MDEDFRKAALDYHRLAPAGKLSVEPTKRMANQRDLALAYSPGVAAACEEIVANPETARELTARGNLVAVISNGTAVLGLGNIGPLAGKPVMEGKAVLFKKFAGIDVFDIEVDATDPAKFIEVVAALEPTFGGINLEDIKAPECFEIEEALKKRMKIPVFHDDQHGTAIVSAAAITNGLVLQGKKLEEVKLVTSGAGASALSCVRLLIAMGLKAENVILTDSKGVVHAEREHLSPLLAPYARKTNARTLADALPGADIFLGLSAPRVFNPDWLPLLADKPLIMALANPEPEILPELITAARPDAIYATGRSDYPNQVNNVLCFPYIFRGALDVGAVEINQEMKLAAVEAIAELARVEPEETVASAYGGASLIFGPDHIIPKPFDPRLAINVPVAVARAAMATGAASRTIDLDEYRVRLRALIHRSDRLMNPVFEAARKARARLAYGEGTDERVLRAAQTAVDEKLARPVLIGSWGRISDKIHELGLRLQPGRDVEIVDPQSDDALIERLLPSYRKIVERRGVSLSEAARMLRDIPTVTAAMLLRAGEVDGALCGGIGDWGAQVKHVMPIIPRRDDVGRAYALSGMIVGNRTLFFCDTHLNLDPSAQEIAEMTLLAAEAVRGFGIVPKVALLSHSNYGASEGPSARKMRHALQLVREQNPDFAIDGEMHGDAALGQPLREKMTTDSPLVGSANLLVMPNLDAANISITLLAGAANALGVGPLLIGMSKPIHILVEAATARSIVNMTALAAAEVARN